MEERKNEKREEGVGVKTAVYEVFPAFFSPFLLIFPSPSLTLLIQIYNFEMLLRARPDYLEI